MLILIMEKNCINSPNNNINNNKEIKKKKEKKNKCKHYNEKY